MYKLITLLCISMLIFNEAGCYVSHYRVPAPTQKPNTVIRPKQITTNSSFNQNRYSTTKPTSEDSNLESRFTETLSDDSSPEQEPNFAVTTSSYKPKQYSSMTHSNHRTLHLGVWKQIQELCGYYKMCYNQDMYVGYSLMSSCCPQCSCHATCVLANNCCPDADVNLQDDLTAYNTLCLPLYDILTCDQPETEPNPSKQAQNQPEHNTGTKTKSNSRVEGKKVLSAYEIHRHLELSGTHPTIYNSYLTVTACPAHTKNTDLVRQCLRPTSIYTSDYIPVFDVRTQILYKNIFCAQCHNATGYTSWELVTNCTSLYLMDFTPAFIEDLRSIAAQGCLVYLDPSNSMSIQSLHCKDNQVPAASIQICNVTGLLIKFDPYIVSMCEEESHMTWYTDSSGTVYKNIYCYMCNVRQIAAVSQPCNQHLQQINNLSTFAGKFNARVPLTVAERGPSIVRQEEIATFTNASCSNNYVLDVYMNKCRLFKCPMNKKAIYSICLDKSYRVTGLVVVGRLHIQLADGVTAQDRKYSTQGRQQVLKYIQNRLTSYLQVYKHGCLHLPGTVYGRITEGQLHEFYWLYKIQNTEDCNIDTVMSIFTKIYSNNIVLQPEKQSRDRHPGFSVKMTYTSLDNDNFTFSIVPPVGEYENHEVMLNASFHCQRVVMTVAEYQNVVDAGKLQPLDSSILQQEYTLDTGLVEVCLTDYLQHWFLQQDQITPLPVYYNKVDVTLSVIATVISMLSITVVMVTYCLFSDLRFVPGKLVMILCTNLFLAQAFYAFGLDLGIDNFWCKLFGICIHFFWLATLFSMNSILFLMLRSLQRPLDMENRVIIESKSITELMKYIAHCYSLPFVCVILNMLSSSFHLTEEFGYGGSLCYIRTAKMRLLTFGVPLGIVMLINFILFALIMILMSKYMRKAGNNVPIKQILIFFKLITITGMYWLFGFLYEFTKLHVFSYLFIVLNAGQGFFLMWSFLYNSHIYSLYRTSIDKYIRKLREYSSESASTA